MNLLLKTSAFCFIVTAFSVVTFAHNYHTSLTRIDFNKKEKILEIEINLFNHDLEKVLEKRNNKRIDLEKSKEIDKLLFDYVNEEFVVTDNVGGTKMPVWVGKEINTDMTTVYIEIDKIENLDGLKLQNKFFFESFSEQVNLVTIHTDDKRIDLAFKTGDNFKDFLVNAQNQR
ncbi:MAG: DUF6702 family protein [Pyrinomonadaceae bacterium]